MKNAGFHSLEGIILLSVLMILSGFNNVNAETKLTAFDGAAYDYFGQSVAISGNTAVIGAAEDDENSTDSGSAYVFVRDTTTGSWSIDSKLKPSDGAVGDSFGDSVAISGDTTVIGAHGDDDNGPNSGSAYVFVRDPATDNWIEQPKLLAQDGAGGDRFGRSVAISGDIAVVGASRDDDNGPNSGSAYVFVRDPKLRFWQQQSKLLASDGAVGDSFGSSVAISGNTAVIGAYLDDDRGLNSGSAYVFVQHRVTDNWSEQDKLTSKIGISDDHFGDSVAISGDTAVVGAHSNDSGSTFVFERDPATDNWIEQPRLTAADGAVYDEFGWSVAISGDTAVIGAHGDDDNGPNSGSAYVFVRDPATGSWRVDSKLKASDGAEVDHFGFSVAISGDTAVVGAESANEKGKRSGSAYVYKLPDPQDISVSHTSHDFGSVNVGSTSPPHTFTVTNMGDRDLIIRTLGVTGAGASEFSIQNDNCSAQTIATSGTCTAGIVFSPASEGTKSANLTIPSNDPDTPILDVPLSGVGGICTYSISPANQLFSSDGGTDSVSVTTADGCNWAASSNTSWTTITSGSTVSGNGTVNYSVSPNTSTSLQTGTMTIAGKTFTVTQAGVGTNPTPDIETSATGVTVTPTDNISVTVALDPGSRSGENADWWVAADTPLGWFYLDASTMLWVFAGSSHTDLIVTYQGPLFNLSMIEILNIPVSGFPSGTYTFYFVVDTNMNGVLDFGELFFDSVVVNIMP